MCTSVRSLNSCLSVSLRCAERCAASRIALENHILGHVRAGAGPGDQKRLRLYGTKGVVGERPSPETGSDTRHVPDGGWTDGLPPGPRAGGCAALPTQTNCTRYAYGTKNCTKNCTRYGACPTPRRHPTPAPAPSPPDAPAHRAALSHTFPPDHLPHPPHALPTDTRRYRSLATVPVSPCSSPPYFPGTRPHWHA